MTGSRVSRKRSHSLNLHSHFLVFSQRRFGRSILPIQYNYKRVSKKGIRKTWDLMDALASYPYSSHGMARRPELSTLSLAARSSKKKITALELI